MLRAISIVVLLGAGVFVAFGSAHSGSSLPTVAGPAEAGSGHAAPQDVAAQSGVAAIAATVRGLTAVFTAVSRSWWRPLEATLELVQDTVYRGWSAIRRFPRSSKARQ